MTHCGKPTNKGQSEMLNIHRHYGNPAPLYELTSDEDSDDGIRIDITAAGDLSITAWRPGGVAKFSINRISLIGWMSDPAAEQEDDRMNYRSPTGRPAAPIIMRPMDQSGANQAPRTKHQDRWIDWMQGVPFPDGNYAACLMYASVKMGEVAIHHIEAGRCDGACFAARSAYFLARLGGFGERCTTE